MIYCDILFNCKKKIYKNKIKENIERIKIKLIYNINF